MMTRRTGVVLYNEGGNLQDSVASAKFSTFFRTNYFGII